MSNYATLGLDINAASGTSDNENRSNDEATAVKGCGCEQGVPCEHDNDDSNGGHYHGDGHDHGGCGGHAHDMIERFSTQIGGENGKGIVAAATLGSEASATAGSSAEGTGVVFQSIPNPTSQDLASGNLGFTLNDTGGVGAGTQALAGFQAAAELWTYLLGDNININLDVGFSALDPGILGSTGSTKAIVYYDDVRTALVNDQTSAEDASAASNLAAGNSLSFVTNDTNGTQIVDSDGSVNNRVLAINSANAKALGITVDANGNAINPNQSDGSVRFSSSFNWDFDPTDGIDAGAQDFVGVAFHEIGHALGFTSGVDIVDQYTGSGPGGQLDLNGFAIFNVLDLFRYSGSGQLNYAIGGNPYFSIDGGNTAELGATFSTGSFQGDGRQASHWKDGLGLGILDPTANPSGNLNNVSNLDLLAFDVVGYDRVVDNVAQGNEFNNSLNGSAVRDLIDGRGGNDILNGFAGEDRLVGRTGDDTLNGGAGADILDGGDGNDTASYAGATGGVSVSLATGTGSAGDAAGDSLISIENLVGSSGNDILTGGDGSNVIDAGDGDDSLFGSQSNNGWDFLNGEAGNDTYTFERTNGNTKIDATQSETANSGVEDKVVFTDLSLVDFTIGYDAESNDALRLIWENGAGTSELQIEQEGQHIEIFEFGDGTTLSEIEGDFLARLNPTVYSNFYANRLTGTDGDDFIQGTGRRDYIYAGAGDDDLSAGGNSDAAFQYLFGQAGDDTYRISKEDGRIFILANAETESSGTNDKVIFSDLGLTDIVFDTYDYTGTANAAQGNTLRLTWNDGTNNGELWVAQDGRHIESYEFADGSTFEANFLARLNPTVYSNFYANRLIGTDGDDVIQGTDRRDYIYAGAGNDDLSAGGNSDAAFQYLFGQAGDDTYRVSKEDGRVFILANAETESSGTNDKVIFSDLGLTDIVFDTYDYTGTANAAQGNTLRLTWNDGTNIGELWVAQDGRHIESYEFADGSSFEANFLARLNPTVFSNFYANRLTGSSGDDVLQGTDRRDYIYGGAGNDDLSAGGNSDAAFQYLFGQAGDDTYRISKEDGRIFVSIGAESSSTGNNDKVVFEDLNRSDITIDFFDYSGTANSTQGNALRLIWNDGVNNGELWIAREGQHIETFEFADGSTYSSSELISGVGGAAISTLDSLEIVFGNTSNTATITEITEDAIVTGGLGVDLFFFDDPDFGEVTIQEFDDGMDQIDLALLDLAFSDLSISQNGADTEINIAGNADSTITLADIDASLIGVEDFVL